MVLLSGGCVKGEEMEKEHKEKEQERRREEKVQRAILRKIWKFIEFKSPENWEIAQLGYFSTIAINGNSYICHIINFGGRYTIRLSKSKTVFFEFDSDIADMQNDKLINKFAELYKQIDSYIQKKSTEEKEKLLTRFLRESNRIGKHVKHDDRPMRPAYVKTTARQRKIKK